MSRGPKFADPTRPRGIYGTPTYKYLLAAGITLSGIIYGASYCIYSLLIKKRLEESRSRYTFVPGSFDKATNKVIEKVLILRYLAKKEDEAKEK